MRVIITCLLLALCSCQEKINPFENTGITTVKTDDFGFAAWNHGLPYVPFSWQIEVKRAECVENSGRWGNTQLFVRIIDCNTGKALQCHEVVVQWQVE